MALLGPHSATHHTLQVLLLEAMEEIPLHALFQLSAALPAINTLIIPTCISDLSPSPTATQQALQALLDAKRYALTSLALSECESTLLDPSLLQQLLRDGAPNELHLFGRAAECNAFLNEHKLTQPASIDIVSPFQLNNLDTQTADMQPLSMLLSSLGRTRRSM